MGPLTELSLFTGYAGITLGLRLAGVCVRTVCYVEIDSYCQRTARARIRDQLLDDAPIWDDVRTFDGRPWRGLVDIVTAGFPCQPHSVAGRRAGATDDRNLWPDTLRVVSEVRPRYLLLENAGIQLRDGFEPAYAYTVLAELASIGYDAEWASVPAAAVGAPDLRWRWWCLAHSHDPGRSRRWRTSQPEDELNAVRRGQFAGPDGQGGAIPDADGRGRRPDQPDLPPGQPHAAGHADAAHADGQGEQQPQGTVGQERGRSGDGGETMDDSEGQRRQERWISGRAPEEHAGPEHPGEDVSDSGCVDARPQPVSQSGSGDTTFSHRHGGDGTMADSEVEQVGTSRQPRQDSSGVGWWAVEPEVGRVVDGHPHRVDQITALGNGVVPAVVAKFLRVIDGQEDRGHEVV